MKNELLAVFQRKRDTLATRSKWGLALLAALALMPITWWVASAILGLAAAGAALGVAVAVGLAVVHGAPALSMKFANWKLAAMKAEAERNPIETLQNQQAKLTNDLQEMRARLRAFDAEVENFRANLRKEVDKGFAEAAARGLPALRNMERLCSFRYLKYKKAKERLAARAKAVQMAEANYRVALAVQRVTEASGEAENSVLEQVLEDVAFGAVDNAVHTCFAELRIACDEEALPAEDADLSKLDQVMAVPALPQGSSNLGLNLLELGAQLNAPVLDYTRVTFDDEDAEK